MAGAEYRLNTGCRHASLSGGKNQDCRLARGGGFSMSCSAGVLSEAAASLRSIAKDSRGAAGDVGEHGSVAESPSCCCMSKATSLSAATFIICRPAHVNAALAVNARTVSSVLPEISSANCCRATGINAITVPLPSRARPAANVAFVRRANRSAGVAGKRSSAIRPRACSTRAAGTAGAAVAPSWGATGA